MQELNVSSIAIDENTGIAKIIIDGTLPVPNECDDPIVELFRPIRAKHKEKMFFVISVYHRPDDIVCTILPSNRRNRPQPEFLKIAITLLKERILNDYETLLELFFTEKSGLKRYLENIEKGSFEKADNDIKKFVNDVGLEMPSLKKIEKKPKTKAQKRADSKAYQAKHPEILANKKPAN